MKVIGNDPRSIMHTAFQTARFLKGFDDTLATKQHYRQEFPHLLQPVEGQGDGAAAGSWDPETRQVYEKVPTDLGRAWKAVVDHDPPSNIMRRIVMLPMDFPKRYLDLVEEQEPRALVMLGHYFAMLSLLRNLWWIGDSGSREVRAISRSLPAEWQELMAWPLRMLSLDPIPLASLESPAEMRGSFGSQALA